MGTLERRVKDLERQTEISETSLVIVGEPSPEQKAALDQGRVHLAVSLRASGRDRGQARRQN